MRVAIVHDWLTNFAGAERVVLELHKLYPDAPIFTSVYDSRALPQFVSADVRTTWLQKIPSKLKFKHQLWTPLRPLAFRSLDLSGYDVVISSSSAESKQVRVGENTTHVCYCHTPIRYFWVNPDYYVKNPGLGPLNMFARIVVPAFLRSLKKSDYKAAQRVDRFIANSSEVKNRIKKYYGRDSEVIHPPVDVERFKPSSAEKREGFVILSRLIPYKRIDIAVQACSELGLPLTVIGSGPELESLKAIAGETVTFAGFVADEDVPKYFHKAEAFIFAAEEDFGIAPVEAMAAGLPVIAFGRGGAKDYVIEGETGVFFNEQTSQSLKNVLKEFDAKKFDSEKIVEHAEKFSAERFRREIKEYLSGLR